MEKHTSGPWRWVGTNKNPKGFCYLSSETEYVGVSLDGFTDDKANARLIAAAPDLLEALQGLMFDLEGKHDFTSARAAIAKATGVEE